MRVRTLSRCAVPFGLAGLLCAACTTAPQKPVVIETPPSWQTPSSNVAADALTNDWFRAFGSDELDALIALAYQNSLDLQAADARLRQADARARAAGGAILPQVDFGANATSFSGHSTNGSGSETDWAALVSASYEIDFWGGKRAARDSAAAVRKASAADRDTVALSTVTGVVNTYFQIVTIRERAAIVQSAVDNARALLQVVEARNSAGLASPTEVAQQRAALAGAQIKIVELQQQESEAQAALALLVGKMPGTLAIKAQQLSDFSAPRVSPGLPSALLSRRPDVSAAEETLRAAHADLVQARAALFPAITLTGSGGLQNPAVQAGVLTLAGVGPSLTVGAGLVQTIFDGGRLRAARDEAVAREQEMLVHYRSAALSALWDVQTALSAIEHLDRQSESQQESLAQNELALAGAQARYREGSTDFLVVLDAQRALLSAREQMTLYRLARLQASVGLCKALGGGWVQAN